MGIPLSALLLALNVLTEAAMVVLILYLLKRGNHYKAHRNRLLREKEVMLDYVQHVGEAFADAENIDLDIFLERVLFYSMRTTKALSGAIYMFDSDNKFMRANVVAGIFPPLTRGERETEKKVEEAASKSEFLEEYVKSHPIRKGEGIVGEAADFGMSILIEDAERDARIPKYASDYLKIKSIILVPMCFRNSVLGVLVVSNRTDGGAFSQENRNLLEGLAAQASASAHFISLRETIEAQKRMEHDLDVARNIQAALLPAKIPQAEGFEIAAFNRPALAIGGDYYDVIRIDESHIGLAIADVSGKGIPGAILMSSCRSILRALAQWNLDGIAVLKDLNRAMTESVGEDMFISMLYMILNTASRELSIFRAGHETPLIWRADAGGIEGVESKGVAIGLTDSETFDTILGETKVKLRPGDCVLAYTDGITEAMDCSQNEWGLDSLKKSVSQVANKDASSIINTINDRLDEFTNNCHQYDDMTMLVLKAEEIE